VGTYTTQSWFFNYNIEWEYLVFTISPIYLNGIISFYNHSILSGTGLCAFNYIEWEPTL